MTKHASNDGERRQDTRSGGGGNISSSSSKSLNQSSVDRSEDEVVVVVTSTEESIGKKGANDSFPVSSCSAEETRQQQSKRRIVTFFFTYDFPIAILIVIGLAKAYPPLGAIYLAPNITATWVAIILMFFLNGLGLKTKEFFRAMKKVGFNMYDEFFSFIVCSSFVFGVSRLLIITGVLPETLADGMVICSCLPLALNTAIVLTIAAGGDEAVAVFHTAVGNIIGVFASPLLILMYLGASGNVSFPEIIFDLSMRVIVPLAVGQFFHIYFSKVREFYVKHQLSFKMVNKYCLVFVVYTVFCKTFMHGTGISVGNVFLMVLFQLICMIVLMALAWYSIKFLFPSQPKLWVMGIFGCTHKCIALGVPLISIIYKGNPNEGLYTLPILVWYPMSLVVGSLVLPRIKKVLADETDSITAEPTEKNSTADIEKEEDIENPIDTAEYGVDDDDDDEEKKDDETPLELKEARKTMKQHSEASNV